jgi:hypothetical protein
MSRKHGGLNIPQPYGFPQSVIQIALNITILREDTGNKRFRNYIIDVRFHALTH